MASISSSVLVSTRWVWIPLDHGGQQRCLCLLHPLDVQLHVSPGPEVQLPFHEAVYLMFHNHIVDNSPVIHNGVQFRLHLVSPMAAQEGFLHPVFSELLELIARGVEMMGVPLARSRAMSPTMI